MLRFRRVLGRTGNLLFISRGSRGSRGSRADFFDRFYQFHVVEPFWFWLRQVGERQGRGGFELLDTAGIEAVLRRIVVAVAEPTEFHRVSRSGSLFVCMASRALCPLTGINDKQGKRLRDPDSDLDEEN
jgi:hypothetical protein